MHRGESQGDMFLEDRKLSRVPWEECDNTADDSELRNSAAPPADHLTQPSSNPHLTSFDTVSLLDFLPFELGITQLE